MLDNSVRTEWPPYNIEKKSENDYRISWPWPALVRMKSS